MTPSARHLAPLPRGRPVRSELGSGGGPAPSGSRHDDARRPSLARPGARPGDRRPRRRARRRPRRSASTPARPGAAGRAARLRCRRKARTHAQSGSGRATRPAPGRSRTAWMSRSYCDGSSSEKTRLVEDGAGTEVGAGEHDVATEVAPRAEAVRAATTRPMPCGWELRTPARRGGVELDGRGRFGRPPSASQQLPRGRAATSSGRDAGRGSGAPDGHGRGRRSEPAQVDAVVVGVRRLDGGAVLVAAARRPPPWCAARAEEDGAASADGDRGRALLRGDVGQAGVDPDDGPRRGERRRRRRRASGPELPRSRAARARPAAVAAGDLTRTSRPAAAGCRRQRRPPVRAAIAWSARRSRHEQERQTVRAPDRGRAHSGTGRVKSASMPKSAQMRPRMSLIDERSEGLLERRRAPPVVALQRVVTEVDEPAVGAVAVERLLVDAAGRGRRCARPAGSARLTGRRARSRRRAPRPASMSAWIAGSETTRSPEPERDRGDVRRDSSAATIGRFRVAA